MGIADRILAALASIIRLEDKVTRQGDVLKSQQARIEDLTARIIRLEAQFDLLTRAALIRRLPPG